MSLKTVLNSKHIELGAKMGDFAGFDMPLQYSSPQEEVQAVRTNVGMFDVSHMGEFFVEGPDAVKYVDYMLPNNFSGLATGKAMYSPLLNEKGGMVDDLIAYKLTETKAMICVNASNIKKDYQWFEKFKGKFECQLADHSENYSLLAVQGPKAMEIVKNIYPEAESVERFGLLVPAPADENPFIMARTGYTGEEGFEIFATHGEIESLWEKLIAAGVTPCGLVARDVLRMEACFPLYGHELSDEVTPFETGLKWTVKMEADDFVGKSALQERSITKKQIKLFIEKGIPREGYKIYNKEEKEVGIVTSGTYSPTIKKGIALGLITSEQPLDDEFIIQIRKNFVPATRIKKSFLAL